MATSRTAIIVNERGEGFTGWFSHCDISASGFETYRSEPHFAKRELLRARSHPLFDYYPPHDTWVNEPKVFADKRSAERALKRIERRVLGGVVVVS